MIEISHEEFLHITLAVASITGKMRKSCTIFLRWQILSLRIG